MQQIAGQAVVAAAEGAGGRSGIRGRAGGLPGGRFQPGEAARPAGGGGVLGVEAVGGAAAVANVAEGEGAAVVAAQLAQGVAAAGRFQTAATGRFQTAIGGGDAAGGVRAACEKVSGPFCVKRPPGAAHERVLTPFRARDESVPRPGIEPGTPRSKRGMMSVSPSGHERKVRDSNPQGMFQPSRLATEFLSRSDTFRRACSACRSSVDPPGLEPGSPACHAGIFPLDDGPVLQWTAGDSNPDCRRAKPVSCRIGRAAQSRSDPAWTRTMVSRM